MDETLKKIESDLFKLDFLNEELVEAYNRKNKLKNINKLPLDNNFFGSKIHQNINNSILVNRNDLEKILIDNVEKGLFRPKIYVNEPSGQHLDNSERYHNWCIYSFCIGGLISIFIFFFMVVSFEHKNIVGGIIWLIIYIFLLGLPVIFGLMKKREEKTYDSEYDAYKSFLSRLPSVYKNEIDKKIIIYTNTINTFIKERDNEIDALNEYIDKLELMKKSILDGTQLPLTYANDLNAVSIMLNIILSKRADTLKEMINLYEQDCKMNCIISEIRKSNDIFIQSMSNYQTTIANCSNLISSEMNELKAIACAPIRITGTTYTY